MPPDIQPAGSPSSHTVPATHYACLESHEGWEQAERRKRDAAASRASGHSATLHIGGLGLHPA